VWSRRGPNKSNLLFCAYCAVGLVLGPERRLNLRVKRIKYWRNRGKVDVDEACVYAGLMLR
jgi:hypothetical protein